MRRTGMKTGLVKTVYLLMKDAEITSYPELQEKTGFTRDQIARAVKYLRSEGHAIRSITKGGHGPATLQYISGFNPIRKKDRNDHEL